MDQSTNEKGIFYNAAKTTLEEVQRILEEREQQYGDSWSVDCRPFLTTVLRKHGLTIPEELKREIEYATYADGKLKRMMTGEYKPDNNYDLINYVAALTTSLNGQDETTEEGQN